MRGRPTHFWGKLSQDESGNVLAWHPLLCHCADVAMSTKALLTRSLLARRLATLCARRALTPRQVARLCVLAALHDFGKTNHGFQAKQHPSSRRTAGHLREALAALLDRERGIGDALVDALDLRSTVCWFESEQTLLSFLRAILAHHGRPLEESLVDSSLWLPRDGIDPIAGVRSLVDATKRWFPLAWQIGGDPLPASPELQHAFTGLLMLADWIGSDGSFFPFADSWPNETYHQQAEQRAEAAVAGMGIDSICARDGLTLGDDLYDTLFGFRPRGAQSACLEVRPAPGPSTTILEAPTGEGKTEMALARFASLFEAGEVDGLYFALPTRTSATQIHQRVVTAVARMYPDPKRRPAVVLAVPGYLRADDTDGVRLPGFEVLWPDDRSQATRHRRWAAEGPKRYLAGVVAIGTVDQALLSVLTVNHSHLRATALLRHLLVIDEVHASDAYMTRLTESLLARHRAAGGHAFLMSATLGGTARQRLLEPGGLGSALSLADATAKPYPLVTHLDATQQLTESNSNGQPSNAKTVHFEVQPWSDEPRDIVDRALDAAARGAKVLILRNTVKTCLATQLALETSAAQRGEAALLFSCEHAAAPHHARFAAVDRKRLDLAIEANFGKTRPVGGCVAVCTQTVQQSLDLDADLMLTDRG
jgi:CRISPR-associated endonuclease/helicase Cas3